MSISRRGLIGAGVAGAAVCVLPGGSARAQEPSDRPLHPELVREFVLVAHQKKRFEEWKTMLEREPALVNATMDWRHGDWETALGAAAHMGFVEHAEFLLERGARMDVFCAALLDQVDVVRAMAEADERVPFVLGPHGFTLMHHARQGQAEGVQEYLRSVGGDDGAEGWTYEREDFYRGVYMFPSGSRTIVSRTPQGYVFADQKRGRLLPRHVRAHSFVNADESFHFRMNGVGAWGLEVQRGEEREIGMRQ